MRAVYSLCLLAACGRPSGAAQEAGAEASVVDVLPDIPALPAACATPIAGTTITLRRLASKVFGIATLVTAAPGDPRVFVVEMMGGVRIYRDELLQGDRFLDLRADVGGPVAYDGTELGLLGLAFHPRFVENGLFFVDYTTGSLADNSLRDVVARCAARPGDPDHADPASCVEVLSIPDPGRNHNGGMIEFGSDGLLYVATGDGGGPTQAMTSQDPHSLLGKMLRIDVDHGGAPEIFMLGLRNPWRWTFDPATGDMWIGDVGRSAVEELDVLAPAEQPGANLGWSMYEGSTCFTPPCDPAGKTFPKLERDRATTHWAAIIGGQVYRGGCYPDLVGSYLYGDEQVGAYALARLQPDRTVQAVDLTGSFPIHPTSFHADARGELYMTDVSGYVYRVEAGP